MELLDVGCPKTAHQPAVPEHLGRVLYQVAFLEVDHKSSLGEAPNSLQGVLQHLHLLVSIDRNVVKVYHYRKGTVAWLALEDQLHYKLKVRGRLG